ncbi:MAG: DUF1801 domain-containing protein [Chloroflexota bacterium]
MAELKTKRNKASVKDFLAKIKDPRQRADAQAIVKMMHEAAGAKPEMWGSSIVGFGSYHYKGRSGREGDWPLVGFSPRKQNLTLYIMPGFQRYADLMGKLGKYKTGGSCLYIRRLDDVHLPTLKKLVRESVKVMKKAAK